MVSPKRLSLLAVALVVACGDPNPTSGSIVVTVDGLPVGGKAAVRLTGPEGYARTLEETQTVDRLPPGDYVLRVSPVEHLGAVYSSEFGQQTVSVSVGAVESRSVGYALSSGGVNITIDGLPTGSPARVTLRRPDGFSRAVTISGLQMGLPAGVYTLDADTAINAEGDVFSPNATSQSITVAASADPAIAGVSYTRTTGVLELDVSGLPTGLPFDPVTVTGPNGFFASAKGARSLHGLPEGTYTVKAASAAAGCPTMYVPSAAQQVVEVSTTSDAVASIAYTQGVADPADLNLSIVHSQVIQVTQDSANNVPMVANRAGLLRLYGVANQCNTSTPAVRVTFTNGTVVTAPAAESSVRTLLHEGILDATWNVTIPADEMQAGLGFFAEIDPANAVAEANEADNRFPATGNRSISIVDIPTVGIRFVPIAQPTNGTPVVEPGNVGQYMQFSSKIHPVPGYDIQVRSPLSTSTNISGGNDGNAWITILSEVNAARVNDSTGTPTARFYHGIVRVPYTSGIAGIGFIGGRAAVTWEHLPSASEVVAHELGHNFGRFHAPCGGPAGPDPNFPYHGGKIGKFGYDAATLTLKEPTAYTDVMGYCSSQWISDYTYRHMMSNLLSRQTMPGAAAAARSTTEPVVLVWGRIVNGVPVLEPAFETVTQVQLPPAGEHRLTAYTREGRAFEVAFAAQRIADVPGDNEVFAFTIPRSALRGQPLDSLQLTARGRVVRSRMSVATTADPQLRVTRASARSARVRWDATRYPVAMIRDPRTGDVLSFARGGDATIVTQAQELEVNVSNRVRSAKLVRPIR